MSATYLFDWGDTLKVDFPNALGKMHLWPTVKCIDGATTVLSQLAKDSAIYIATNAADSDEHEIRKAFERVELAQYISGYFCFANTGLNKSTPAFYLEITKNLGVAHEDVIMVGDTFEKDIRPALAAGLSAIWYNPSIIGATTTDTNIPLKERQSFREIHHLDELLTQLEEFR
ncbi:HAD family hydrolase [Paraglaciecola mesophila]|uniref:HAD family hydrolase n=1 Tax=Paraglaciecola mesophila TaxID=197222 RepID=A0ABU9SQB9_9ALTE